jgi:hypothetical protein
MEQILNRTFPSLIMPGILVLRKMGERTTGVGEDVWKRNPLTLLVGM